MNQTTTAQSAGTNYAAESLRPKGSIPLRFGALTGLVTGGPFKGAKYWAGDDLTIKLAREINEECDVNLPIADFSVPSELAANEALIEVLKAFDSGQNVYAGCMAGQGRTGLFIALLVKLALDYEAELAAGPLYPDFEPQFGTQTDPVLIVRSLYYRHAVETSEQADFVRNFNTDNLTQILDRLQPVSAPQEKGTSWVSRLWSAFKGVFTGRRAA